MIYKNSVFVGGENPKQRHLCPSTIFGTGDVRMTNSFTEDYTIGRIELKNDTPIKVGDLEPSNDNPPDMLWIFEDTESIDSVIMQLQTLKYSMENKTLFHPKKK